MNTLCTKCGRHFNLKEIPEDDPHPICGICRGTHIIVSSYPKAGIRGYEPDRNDIRETQKIIRGMMKDE